MTLVFFHHSRFCQILKILNNKKNVLLLFGLFNSLSFHSLPHFPWPWNIMLQFPVYSVRMCKMCTLMHSHIYYVPMPTKNQIHTLSHAYTNICNRPYTYSTYTCEHICALTHAYTNYAYCTVHAYTHTHTHTHLFHLQNNSHEVIVPLKWVYAG